MTLPSSDIEKPFDDLIGLEAWGTKIGVGTFITIEFGPPSQGTDGHGACHLWVGSDDSKAAMQLGVAGLNGCTIRRATCSEYGDLRLEFSSGQVLSTLAHAKSLDDSPWVLVTPAGTYSGHPRRGERWLAEPSTL